MSIVSNGIDQAAEIAQHAAQQYADALKKLNAELVAAGHEAIDVEGKTVPELIDYAERRIEGGFAVLASTAKALVSPVEGVVDLAVKVSGVGSQPAPSA